MKKNISCIMTCVLLIGMLLVGCGGKDMSGSPYVGTWHGTKAEYSGLEMSVESIFGDFSLELGKDGKATVITDGEEKKGKWDETDNGVILDGEMELTADGDMLTYEEDGATIYFEKE